MKFRVVLFLLGHFMLCAFGYFYLGIREQYAVQAGDPKTVFAGFCFLYWSAGMFWVAKKTPDAWTLGGERNTSGLLAVVFALVGTPLLIVGLLSG